MDPKQIKRYIDLVYSQESELNKIESMSDRKEHAAAKVGWKIQEKEIQEIMHLQNKPVNKLIFEHLKASSSNKFLLLISNQELFWELQQRLITPLSTSQTFEDKEIDLDEEKLLKAVNLKTTISERCETLLERIDKLYLAIFKASEEVDMATKEIKLGRPEDRVKRKSA